MQSVHAGASLEVQAQSLARAEGDVEAAAEMIAVLADLVVLAHSAGRDGYSVTQFLNAMRRAAESSS